MPLVPARPLSERRALDFISENVVPWTIRDVRKFHYVLQPLVITPPETVLEQAKPLRARGQTIGVTPP